MDGAVQIWLMTFGLILARVSAFIATIPYLGGRFVPQTTKAGASLALTCFWFAESQATSIEVVQTMEIQPWMAFAIAVGREVIIGASLGYVFGLFLVPFRIAGEFIAQEMGLTLGSISDPTRPEMTTTVGDFFELFGVLLFFSQNIHHLFLAALHASFARQPIGGTILNLPVAAQLSAMASATEWGLTLAAPVACCLFITSLVLALMARAAPQFNLYSFGYSARVLVGLVATMFLWPDLVPRMYSVLHQFSNSLIGG